MAKFDRVTRCDRFEDDDEDDEEEDDDEDDGTTTPLSDYPTNYANSILLISRDLLPIRA